MFENNGALLAACVLSKECTMIRMFNLENISFIFSSGGDFNLEVIYNCFVFLLRMLFQMTLIPLACVINSNIYI